MKQQREQVLDDDRQNTHSQCQCTAQLQNSISWRTAHTHTNVKQKKAHTEFNINQIVSCSVCEL